MQLPRILAASGLFTLAVSASNPFYCPPTTNAACCAEIVLGADGASTAEGTDCEYSCLRTPSSLSRVGFSAKLDPTGAMSTSRQPLQGGGTSFDCPASYKPTCCGAIVCPSSLLYIRQLQKLIQCRSTRRREAFRALTPFVAQFRHLRGLAPTNIPVPTAECRLAAMNIWGRLALGLLQARYVS